MNVYEKLIQKYPSCKELFDFIMSTEIEHHNFSPSSFPARSKCIHFESSEAGEPAVKGTFLHLVFANLFGEVIEGWKEEFIFMAVVAGFISDSDIEGVKWAREHFEEAVSEYGTDIKIEIEKKVEILAHDFSKLTQGFVDASIPGIIGDLKTGQIRDYRFQMLPYALANMIDNDLEQCRVIELYSADMIPIDYIVTKEEAEKDIFELYEYWQEKEKYSPSQNDYCKWCKKKLDCIELSENAVSIQAKKEELQGLSYNDSEVLEDISNCLDKYLDDPCAENQQKLSFHSENLGLLYKQAKAVQIIIDGIASNVKKACQLGASIPGLKSFPVSGGHSITSVKKVYESSDISQERFLEMCELKLSSLVKHLENTPDVIIGMYERSDIEFPDNLRGKKKSITKANIKKALVFYYSYLGAISEKPGYIKVQSDAPSSSKRAEVK